MATEPAKEYPAEIVRGTFFEHDILLKDVHVAFRTDPDGYARHLRPYRVNQLIAEFDRQALGVLLLSMRADGSLWCIDGQHRIEVCNHFGIETMDALVYIDLTLEDEARLYRKFGDYLKQTALDRYFAGIAEKKPDYLAINRILSNLGLHVPNALGGGAGSIDAVDAMIRVAKTYSLGILKDTLTLLNDAFGDTHRAYRAICLLGTAAFLTRYQDHHLYNRKLLVQRLARLGVGTMEEQTFNVKKAKLTPEANAAWGMALLAVHNQRLDDSRTLPEWIKRHISEKSASSLRSNLAKVNAAMTPEQKSERVKKGWSTRPPENRTEAATRAVVTRIGYSPRSIVCPLCNAAAGSPCRTTGNGWTTQLHKVRKEQAQLLAQREQLNGGK